LYLWYKLCTLTNQHMSLEHNIGSGVDSSRFSANKNLKNQGIIGNIGTAINRYKQATVLAGGLAVGAGTVATALGCTNETGVSEGQTGASADALATLWNEGSLGTSNIYPDTHWYANNTDVGYRIFTSDGAIYISETSNNGTNWTAPVLVQTTAGNPVNDAAAMEYSAIVCKGGGCGTGKMIFSTDRDGLGIDLWWADWDDATKTASDAVKMPNVNVDYDSEVKATVNSTGTKMLFDRQEGGSDYNIWQADLPGLTNIQQVIGLNTTKQEAAPFFYGADDVVAFSLIDGSSYAAINKANYNAATHSASGVVKINGFDIGPKSEVGGNTDTKGTTCFSAEVDPGDGGPPVGGIYCDPTLPGPTLPDGGSGIDAGGSAGTGGAGGSAGTGGSGLDSGTGGAGGIDAGGTGGSSPDAGTGGAGGAGGTGGTETGGTGGSAGAGGTETGGIGGSAGAGGTETGGTGDTAGQGGTETGGAAGSGPDAGGAGGSGIDAGGTGGTETGGSAGSGVDAGGTETGGSAGSGVDAGEEDGSAPDCRIKVTTNSGDCEVVDCGNYAVGGVVTLHTVNGDCYYIDPLQNVLHITGTGDSYIQQYNLALAQTVGVEVTHPSGNPKITFGYQTDNGSNMNAGTLGTIVDSKVENRNGEKGVYFHVSKDAVDTTICNSNKECTGVSTFDYGAGPGIVTEGKNIWMSFKDIDQIADSISQQPDAGQIITPPAESNDGGGCSLCSASPKDISHDINGWIGLVLVGGAMAYRRSRRA
jgi:hypothetical protein